MMQPLVTSNPNGSFSTKVHPNSNNLSTYSLANLRKRVCISCSHNFSSSSSQIPTNFSKIKSNEKKKRSVFCLDVKHEETENQTNPNSKLLKNQKLDVRALALTLHNANTSDEIAKLLKNYPDLPIPVYSTIIKGLGADKKINAAFALFDWIKENKPPNQILYNTLLSAIKSSRNYHKASDVISDMKLQGLEPNIVTYNTLMSIYIEEGKSHEINNLVSEIELNGLSPSPATYSTLLLSYKELNDANGALEMLIKLIENFERGELDRSYDWDTELLKIKNSTFRICNIILRRWIVKEENPRVKVFKFINKMDKNRIKPNLSFYQGLVWACTKEEHYTIIKELYKRMRENSYQGDEISISACNHVIYLFSKSKKWWAALEVYEEMLDKGPIPNNLSFGLILQNFQTLLMAARRRGIVNWGIKLMDKMAEKGLTPGSIEFNAVLIACSKAGETETAVRIFQKMVDQNIHPEIHSYCALLSALEKETFYDEAINVWVNMVRVGVRPNIHAYTIFASIYSRKGDFDKVNSIIEEMELVKVPPTVVTYNAIISSCVKGDMGEFALEWFDKMKEKNVEPDRISYEVLIEWLVREGKDKLAYQMFVEAFREGLKLGSKAHDLVLEACMASGLSVDYQYFEKMKIDL